MFDDEMNNRRTAPVKLESEAKYGVLTEALGTLTETTGNADSPSFRQDEKYCPHHCKRVREAPVYLKEYECKAETDEKASTNVDYCYCLVFNTLESYKKAVNSPEVESG